MRNIFSVSTLIGLFIMAGLMPVQAQIQQVADVISAGATDATSANFHNRGTVGQPIIGQPTSANFKTGQGFWYIVTQTTGGTAIAANIKAFLQGPFNAGSMSTALNVPLSQPFNTAPWNYGGVEAVGAVPAGVTDWVLVQIYSGNPVVPPMTIESTRAAFIKSNGDIVDTDGSSAVSFSGFSAVGGTNYYLVVVAQNHLDVMTKTNVTLSGSTTYDFTDAVTKAYGDDEVALGGGAFGLYAGDANADNTIKNAGPNSDISAIANAMGAGNVAQAPASYNRADLNMDGKITYVGKDRDSKWVVLNLGLNLNSTKSSNVPAAN